MKNKIGSIVKVRKFSFINKSGGTGMSNWNWDPQIEGEFDVKIIKKWGDYEIGQRLLARP